MVHVFRRLELIEFELRPGRGFFAGGLSKRLWLNHFRQIYEAADDRWDFAAQRGTLFVALFRWPDWVPNQSRADESL